MPAGDTRSFLCLQVIPEVDMPGHGHAAIKAMAARRERFQAANNLSEANRYAGKTNKRPTGMLRTANKGPTNMLENNQQEAMRQHVL